MNILFQTLGRLDDINQSGIYSDLLRCFLREGHSVYAVGMHERRERRSTELKTSERLHILQVKTGNIQRCNLIEKSISTVLLPFWYRRGIKRYFPDVRFDIIIYSTPPITLEPVVCTLKKRDRAKTYLLLKDIFPQNAVDLGMLKKTGLKGLAYRYFRQKELRFYAISDHIGCMSEANVTYTLRHNPAVRPEQIEVCPNAVEPNPIRLTDADRRELRTRYGIPTDKTVFVYGGNLGKPQGIPFLMDCLTRCADNADAFFLIVGNGTEYGKLAAFMDETKPSNAKLLQRLPKEDYDRLVAACDVGLIFLDHRFTIPNFPSRLLSYMQAGLPVLAATDTATDIGTVITSGGFGWWCESNSTADFAACVDAALLADRVAMGAAGQAYLQEHYTVEKAYETIMKAVNP